MADKPKFKIGDEVVYHAGNWKGIITSSPRNIGDEVVYAVKCNEDYCDTCSDLASRPLLDHGHVFLYREDELMEYDEWCDHVDNGGCDKCN
jgi:hypothetical protein